MALQPFAASSEGRIQDPRSCSAGPMPAAVIYPFVPAVSEYDTPSRILRRIRLTGKDKRLSISKYRVRSPYPSLFAYDKAA